MKIYARKKAFLSIAWKGVLTFFSAAFVFYLLIHFKLINFKLFENAFAQGSRFVIYASICLILNMIFLSLRYNYLLRCISLNIDKKNIFAATFVSNAIGMWLPGSIAMAELFRVGLIIGAHKKNLSNFSSSISLNEKDNDNEFSKTSLRAKLTVISMFDRLIGFFIMLSFSSLVTTYFFLKVFLNDGLNLSALGLIITSVISTSLALLIFSLPFIARWKYFYEFLKKWEQITNVKKSQSKIFKIISQLSRKFISILHSISFVSSKPRLLILPFAISFLCFFFTIFSVYFSSCAILQPIPIFAIMSSTAIVTLSLILPLSFAGFGGTQLLAIAALSAFGISPEISGSSQTLQSSLNLAITSFLGILFAGISISQVKAILENKAQN